MYLMEDYWFEELRVNYQIHFGTVSEVNGYFPTGWWALILLHSGTVKLADGERIIKLSAGQLFSLPPSAKFKAIIGTVKMSIVCYTAELAYSSLLLKSSRSYLDHIFSASPITVSIGRWEVVRMSQHFRFLADSMATRKISLFGKELFLLHYNLLLFSFSVVASDQSRIDNSGRNRKEILFLKFLHLLRSNCRKEHSVKFYADTLCITTGYLGRAIREMGGRSAKHFIEMAIVSEAYMLLGDQGLTIAEIAEELAFSGTSTFSTFFKKAAMVSPRAYRESILQNKI